MTAAPLLTAPEVAKWLSVKTFRVYELARAGILPSIRIGKQLRFDAARVNEWLERGGSGTNEAA